MENYKVYKARGVNENTGIVRETVYFKAKEQALLVVRDLVRDNDNIWYYAFFVEEYDCQCSEGKFFSYYGPTVVYPVDHDVVLFSSD